MTTQEFQAWVLQVRPYLSAPLHPAELRRALEANGLVRGPEDWERQAKALAWLVQKGAVARDVDDRLLWKNP